MGSDVRERKATIRETGTSTQSWGAGLGGQQDVFFKAFQPGFDPYIKFCVETQQWLLRSSEEGGEEPLTYDDAQALAAAVLSGPLSAAETEKAPTHEAVDAALDSKADKGGSIASADSVVTALADGTDLATTQALANDLKAKYNAAVALINEMKATLDTMNT